MMSKVWMICSTIWPPLFALSRHQGECSELQKYFPSISPGAPGLMLGKYFCNSLHSPWWRDKAKSGGQIVEQIIHTFDIIRYLLGEPESVFARTANLFHKEVPDY